MLHRRMITAIPGMLDAWLTWRGSSQTSRWRFSVPIGHKPQAVGSRTGRAYQPGIGPHTESQTIRLVTNELVILDQAYTAYALDLPYPDPARPLPFVTLMPYPP